MSTVQEAEQLRPAIPGKAPLPRRTPKPAPSRDPQPAVARASVLECGAIAPLSIRVGQQSALRFDQARSVK